MAIYIPDRGDLVWLTFDPQAGREQSGRRPALVRSPQSYNQKSSLAILCPITSQVKANPFEVLLPTGSAVNGAILADHLKSLDWKARDAQRAGKAPASVLADVRARRSPLLLR